MIVSYYLFRKRWIMHISNYSTFVVFLQLYFLLRNCSELSYPFRKVDFNVSYVAQDSNEDISKNQECLTIYARKFLEKFVTLGYPGQEICRHLNFSIKFNNTAWVHLDSKTSSSKAVFTLNVLIDPLRRNFGLNSMDECLQRLKLWFGNITLLESLLQDSSPQSSFLYIKDNGNCTTVVMKPPEIIHHMSQWICPDNFTLNISDPSNLFCEREFYLSVTTSLSVTGNKTSTKRLTENQENPRNNSGENNKTQTNQQFVISKFWSVKHLKNISQVHITEADRVINFILQITLNKTAICLDYQCPAISMDIYFTNSSHDMLICKSSGKRIPPLILGRMKVNNNEIKENTCSMKLSSFSNASFIKDEDFNFQLNLKAMMNHKINGNQKHKMVINIRSQENNSFEVIDSIVVPIVIEDKDKKATCQSINDPHITSFDGLQFNNFYEGEFVLYQHKNLPFKVHALFQRCNVDTSASCNCGVAVQSGDDVLVIEKCARESVKGLPEIVRRPEPHDSALHVQLYLNGNLTKGTSIYQEAEGKKYLVFLPHGTYVKVMVGSPMINLWIVPSPKDLFMTEGLCGKYDSLKNNDLALRNGTELKPSSQEFKNLSGRIHPHHFMLDWRVDLYSNESLFMGIKMAPAEYNPILYCECWDGSNCIETLDVEYCDLKQGKDITQRLIKQATKAPRQKHLLKRSTRYARGIPKLEDIEPILINKAFVPPKYKWGKNWNNEAAKSFCKEFIETNYTLGQLCSQIKAVDFDQEIASCIEDIQISAGTFWAYSAREAMKEQCLEEMQRNMFLPKNITEEISSKICINDCSQHGTCKHGKCHCEQNYLSSDCSVPSLAPPTITEVQDLGLCDIRHTECTKVIVYGKNFIDGPDLTCHLQECRISENPYQPLNITILTKAIFEAFDAVECHLPEMKSYLIRVSNNGLNMSKPTLFIPYDSACTSCNRTSSTCKKKIRKVFDACDNITLDHKTFGICKKYKNNCIIDGNCYVLGQSSPTDKCLICKSIEGDFQWTTISDGSCKRYDMSDWAVAGTAAVGGSIIGSIVGYLLYRCCCKRSKSSDVSDQSTTSQCHYSSDEYLNVLPNFNSNLLHRSNLNSHISSNIIPDLLGQHTSLCESNSISNELDSSTYF